MRSLKILFGFCNVVDWFILWVPVWHLLFPDRIFQRLPSSWIMMEALKPLSVTYFHYISLLLVTMAVLHKTYKSDLCSKIWRMSNIRHDWGRGGVRRSKPDMESWEAYAPEYDQYHSINVNLLIKNARCSFWFLCLMSLIWQNLLVQSEKEDSSSGKANM